MAPPVFKTGLSLLVGDGRFDSFPSPSAEDRPSGRRIDDRRAHWGAVQPPYRHEHTDECPDDAAAGSAAQSLRFHALIALISSEAKGMAGLFGAPEESEAVGPLCNSGTLAANPPAR